MVTSVTDTESMSFHTDSRSGSLLAYRMLRVWRLWLHEYDVIESRDVTDDGTNGAPQTRIYNIHFFCNAVHYNTQHKTH